MVQMTAERDELRKKLSAIEEEAANQLKEMVTAASINPNTL